MSYITLQEYMSFEGVISLDDSTSSQVNSLLGVTTDMINNFIGDVTLSQKEEQVNLGDIYDGSYFYSVVECNNIEISSLNEVNGLSYTGVLGTDYIITKPLLSRIHIRNLYSYLAGLNFPTFSIKYTSGFSSIPEQIKYAQYLLISGEIANESGQEIKIYTLGPRTVHFSDKKSFDSFKNIISNYSLIKI